VRNVAVAAELVHAATLLHDDVIDQGTERRGAPAARIIYGNAASILGGDHLLLRALRAVRSVGQPELLDSLLATIDQMVDAEAIQLERRGRLDASRDTYLAVIRGKTAALFRWGLHAGGVLGRVDPDSVAALEKAGLALGTAFQLVDDILDLRGDPAVTGKSALADLREGKITWPFIIACERDPDLRLQLAASVKNGGEDPEQIRSVVARVVEVGGVEATRSFALGQRDEAERALEAIAPGPARQALRWVVRFAVERAA
jgi:octaprenyl-diphosphate synthase